MDRKESYGILKEIGELGKVEQMERVHIMIQPKATRYSRSNCRNVVPEWQIMVHKILKNCNLD